MCGRKGNKLSSFDKWENYPVCLLSLYEDQTEQRLPTFLIKLKAAYRGRGLLFIYNSLVDYKLEQTFLYYSKAIKKVFTLSSLTLKAKCNGSIVRRRQCLSGFVYYFVYILSSESFSSVSCRWSPSHFIQVCDGVSPRDEFTSGL